jgi:hypothetical protein
MPTTPQTTIQADGITFVGTLTVRADEEVPKTNDYRGERLAEGGWYGVGKEGKDVANILRLNSPSMTLSGTATATGPPERVTEWELGICQNLVFPTSFTATYDSGVTWRYRLNPDRLPIRDGDPRRAIWYDTGPDALRTLAAGASVTVEAEDAPPMEVPVFYTGDPARLKEAGKHRLVRTAGCKMFRTYLLAVHEGSRSVVVLGGMQWAVDYSGTFIPPHTWVPAEAPAVQYQMLAFGQAAFLNLSGTSALPFDVDLGCAAQNCQVQTAQGWQPCSPNGNPTKPATPDPRKWF